MRHERSGKPKFSCVHMYLDKGNWHERNTIRDEDLEPMVLAALQKQLDLRASSVEMCEMRRAGQQEKLNSAEGRLKELQASLERLHGDQMDAFEAYKDGTTDRETFLQQKEMYDQLEERLNDGIQKQKDLVKTLEKELDSMPEGLAVEEKKIVVDKLTKDVVDAFVEKVIVMPGQQLEIQWKFHV